MLIPECPVAFLMRPAHPAKGFKRPCFDLLEHFWDVAALHAELKTKCPYMLHKQKHYFNSAKLYGGFLVANCVSGVII